MVEKAVYNQFWRFKKNICFLIFYHRLLRRIRSFQTADLLF